MRLARRAANAGAVAADGGRACQDAGQQKREKNFRAGTGTDTATRVWDMDMDIDMGDEPGPICSRNSSARTLPPPAPPGPYCCPLRPSACSRQAPRLVPPPRAGVLVGVRRAGRARATAAGAGARGVVPRAGSRSGPPVLLGRVLSRHDWAAIRSSRGRDNEAAYGAELYPAWRPCSASCPVTTDDEVEPGADGDQCLAAAQWMDVFRGFYHPGARGRRRSKLKRDHGRRLAGMRRSSVKSWESYSSFN